jgi:hypothetical protein
MRKLLLLVLMLCCAGFAKAQNISLSELADLVKLNNEDVSIFLNSGKKFRLVSSEKIKGLIVDTYQTSNIQGTETIIAGAGIIMGNKSVLHKVDYHTLKTAHVYELMRQMERLDYKLTFKGADAFKKIFLYDNGLYRVTVHVNQDEKAGNVEIREKLLGVD